jgi:ABC-type transport system involved in multi-copper enzyme maturation permease subunit
MNFGRIFVLAKNVFLEMVRDRVLYILALYALLLVGAKFILPELAAASEAKILLDFGLAAMSVIGTIIAIFIGTGLLNKEIEKRTILVLISKPVSRSEIIVGKFFGLSAVLAILIIIMTGMYLGCLQITQTSYSFPSIIIAAAFILLQLCLIVAVAITFGSFTSSLLATALTFGISLMGNTTQDLLKLSSINGSSSVKYLSQALYLILPDLSRLDVKNSAVYGLQALPNQTALLTNAGYGLCYSAMLLAIAILIFSRREF